MRRQPAGNHRSFHASRIQSAHSPVAGNCKIVVGVVQRRDAILLRTRQRKNISIGWVYVRRPMLRVETGLIARTRFAAWQLALWIHEQVPPEFTATPDSLGP